MKLHIKIKKIEGDHDINFSIQIFQIVVTRTVLES